MRKLVMLSILVLGTMLIGCNKDVEITPSCNCEYVSYTRDITTDFVLTERVRTDWDGCEEEVLFEETFADSHSQEWYYVIKVECE